MPNLPALLAGDQYLIALISYADGKTAVGRDRDRAFPGDVDSTTACSRWRRMKTAGRVGRSRMQSRFACIVAIREQWLDLSVGRADVVEVPAGPVAAGAAAAAYGAGFAASDSAGLAGERYRRIGEFETARSDCGWLWIAAHSTT